MSYLLSPISAQPSVVERGVSSLVSRSHCQHNITAQTGLSAKLYCCLGIENKDLVVTKYHYLRSSSSQIRNGLVLKPFFKNLPDIIFSGYFLATGFLILKRFLQISWVRKDGEDIQILSHNSILFTTDSRYSVCDVMVLCEPRYSIEKISTVNTTHCSFQIL